MEIAFRLLVVLLLVFLNGYFVASEFALVGARKTRIAELARKKKSAKEVLGALNSLDKYISSTQVGITIASIALGWVGEPALAHLFESLLALFLPEQLILISAHALAVAIAFSIITFLHIVFGELIPKSIALQKAESTSLLIIRPLIIFTNILGPFISLLNGVGNSILRLWGMHAAGEEQAHSEDEIKMILSQSAQSGTIEKEELEMMYNVFQFGDVPIRLIMSPRTEIIAFEQSSKVNEVLNVVTESGQSRFPIFNGTIDNVGGFVHAKDLLQAVVHGKRLTTIQKSLKIRDIFRVPEERRADEVLFDMKRKRTHIAVVSDEYGGTAGIVTLEDIIELITGDIHDEFEKPERDFRRRRDGSYLVDGLVPIDRFKHRFDMTIVPNEYSTIGGYMFGLLGKEPQVGDKVEMQDITLTVEKLDNRRIATILVKQKK